MTKRILISLLLIAFFASCSSSGKVTSDPNSRRLIFGNGGGFTGIYTRYELFEDGNVFILLPDNTLQPRKKIRKKKAQELFSQADKLKIAQPQFNHPGNMTWFITIQADGIITEYKWGDSNVSVPIIIKDLYNQLNTIVK
ncbi:MAG: hypothetical protein Q7U54_12810 [Bacteroidales bacterium]|nr:hypothetical protein [Bacteroidales bacterium]